MDSGYTNNAVSYSDNGDGTIPDRNTGLTWQLQILQFWAPTPSECVATVQLLIVLGQNWNYYYVGRVRQCRNPAKKNIPPFNRKAGLRLTTNLAYNSNFFSTQLLVVLPFKKRVGRVRQCRNPAKKNIPQFDRKAGLRITTNPAYNSNFFSTQRWMG